MKQIVFALTLLSSFIFSPSAFPQVSQGSLTSPGLPAPTMQTLDQLGTKTEKATTMLDQVKAQTNTLEICWADSGTNLTDFRLELTRMDRSPFAKCEV